MFRRSSIALSMVALTCLAPCTPKPIGGVMLQISTDGVVDVRRLTVSIRAEAVDADGGAYDGPLILQSDSRIPDEKALPGTIAIVSNGNPTGAALISLVAYGRDSSGDYVAVDRRDNLLEQVPTDSVAPLPIVLSANCSQFVNVDGGAGCPPGQTCNPLVGGCRSWVVDTSQLQPVYGTAGPSCKGLTTQCQGESCCKSLGVPGGTFSQGAEANPSGGWSSTVDPFVLDKYEVTVGRFRVFAAQYNGTAPAPGAGAHPKISGSGWDASWNSNLPATQQLLVQSLSCDPGPPALQTWTDKPGPNEAKALNCVNWFEAFAFCIWDGGRLPTESEWEYAAAGGSELRLFPWGNANPDVTYATFGAAANGVAGVADVGSTPKGAGKWGHQDLAGNLWEQTLDWFGNYPIKAQHNYAELTDPSSNVRAHRGGAWDSGGYEMSTSTRDGVAPDYADFQLGFRCARSVPAATP